MSGVKIGTCCYCGSKAALDLRGMIRHELACATCGAPLSRMKMLPKSSGGATAPAATPTRPAPSKFRKSSSFRLNKKSKKPKKSKRLGRWVLEEIWDVVEDVFD